MMSAFPGAARSRPTARPASAMKNLTRFLLPTLRYGLCVLAIVLLARLVPWHDQVTLKSPPGAKALLLEEHPDGTYLIEAAGVKKTIGVQDIAGSDGELPQIEYSLGTTVKRLRAQPAILSLFLFLPVPLLAALRLVWMLRIQNVHLPYWHSVKLTFAGNFFNFALPGTTGGDVLKAYWITHLTHHKTEAVTTVFIDRVIGLLGLVMLATVMFVVSLQEIKWPTHLLGSVATGLAAIWGGGIVGSIILFSRRIREGIGLPKLAAKLPASEQILRVGRAMVAVRRHKVLVGLSLLNTIALQLLFVLSAYAMAIALGMQGPPALFLMSVPIGYLIAAFPITPPQAFGVMEFAFVQFFTPGGNTVSQAVTFALATRVIQLIWALPGLLVPLLGLHVPRKSELEELEHDEPSEASSMADAARPR